MKDIFLLLFFFLARFSIPEIRRKGAFTSAVTSFLVSLLEKSDGVNIKQMLLLI